MYFKTTAGKKAIKLMLGGTLLKFGYNRTAGIAVVNEDESDDNLGAANKADNYREP